MDKFKPAGLAAYRQALKDKKSAFSGSIVVSLGTCGIAAGGDAVYETLKEELEVKHMKDIELSQTGCLGMCFCEPNMIVHIAGMPDVLYGYVTPEVAARIVEEHIGKKQIVNNYVIFMPAKDLCAKMGG